MGAVQEILTRAKQQGVELTLDGGSLLVRSRGDLPAELRTELKAHKAELVAALARIHNPAELSESERAALPRKWADSYARLLAMAYPADIDVGRWRLFLDDCGTFLRTWGAQAGRTGWTLPELFALPDGLLWKVEGREVVALSITPSAATIRAKDAPTGPGATAEHRLHGRSLPLPWEMAP